jgi:hypothetical protein
MATSYTLADQTFEGWHGTTGQGNTPEIVTLRDNVNTLAATIASNRDTDVAAVTTLQGRGQVIFAKGITAEDTSTGVTAGTNETAFTNLVQIPADTLAANDYIRVTARTFCVATNSTDTLVLKLKFAAAAGLVASTLVLSSTAAADVANSDSQRLTFEGRVVAIGAAATAKFNGSGLSFTDSAGTALLGTAVNDDTTVATNAIIDVGATYTWSASSAGNQVRIKHLFVEVIRPSA